MSLADQSYQDLIEDSRELDYIVSDLAAKVNQPVLADLAILQQRIRDFAQAVWVKNNLTSLIETKQELYQKLREAVSLTAGIVTATNWQSPMIGGRIQAGINDYSRDQSVPGNEYQRKFSGEFVGRWRGLPVPVFLTNSGMGALTTAITFLLRENKINGPVFIGKNSYFQNKELIKALIPVTMTEFEEEEGDAFEILSKQQKPAVIFIDSLSNTAKQTKPDMKRIVRFLTQINQETYLVIDNTCVALKYNPLKDLAPRRGKLKLLVWESLNKYYQYGLDRTIGGFIWGLPQDTGGLYDARMHAGTIMSDVSQAMLLSPSKKILLRRIERIWRNAGIIAEALGDRCLYSGIGGSLVLKTDQRGMSKVLANAKRNKIVLVAGTSFGLNKTRIYLTATHTKYGEPFVRLSVGTETAWEIDRLIKALIW